MMGAGLSFRILFTDGLVESEAWRMLVSAEATTWRCTRQQLCRSTVGDFFRSNGVCESEEAEGLAWVLGFSSRTRRGPIALLSERAKAAPRALGYVLSFMPLRCCLYCLRAQPYSQCQCFDSRQAGLCLLRGLCIKHGGLLSQ